MMTLHARGGARKYLNRAERQRFARAAQAMPIQVRLFCLVLMWSGCRISEALAITPLAIDREAGTITFMTLKRRDRRITRQVPLPQTVVDELTAAFDLPQSERDDTFAAARLWPWHRSTAWRHVKQVMRNAGISATAAMPKGLRHAFGVAAFESAPPHIVQRWLGHASLRTTAIYGDVSGHEERLYAERIWDQW